MRKITTQSVPWWLAVAILFTVGTRSSFSELANNEDEVPSGYVRLITLQNQEKSLRSLVFVAVDWYADRRIERHLIRTPTGEHVVLTEIDFPRSGQRQLQLLIEETGWAAELVEHTGMRFESISEAADPGAFASRYLRGEVPRRVTFRAPGLKDAFQHLSTTWDDGFWEDFFLLLSAQEETLRVVQDMGPSSQRAIRFLHSLSSCERCSVSVGVGMEPLIALLVRAIEEEATESIVPNASETWKATVEFTAGESSEHGAAAREFVEEFKSLTMPDILADLRPTEAMIE